MSGMMDIRWKKNHPIEARINNIHSLKKLTRIHQIRRWLSKKLVVFLQFLISARESCRHLLEINTRHRPIEGGPPNFRIVKKISNAGNANIGGRDISQRGILMTNSLPYSKLFWRSACQGKSSSTSHPPSHNTINRRPHPFPPRNKPAKQLLRQRILWPRIPVIGIPDIVRQS